MYLVPPELGNAVLVFSYTSASHPALFQAAVIGIYSARRYAEEKAELMHEYYNYRLQLAQ